MFYTVREDGGREKEREGGKGPVLVKKILKIYFELKTWGIMQGKINK